MNPVWKYLVFFGGVEVQYRTFKGGRDSYHDTLTENRYHRYSRGITQIVVTKQLPPLDMSPEKRYQIAEQVAIDAAINNGETLDVIQKYSGLYDQSRIFRPSAFTTWAK
jgi:hypothetical protein